MIPTILLIIAAIATASIIIFMRRSTTNVLKLLFSVSPSIIEELIEKTQGMDIIMQGYQNTCDEDYAVSEGDDDQKNRHSINLNSRLTGI